MKAKPQASVASAGKEIDGKGFSLRGVIDRYEGNYAVLVFDDGQRLRWPSGRLPSGAREGVAVVVTLTINVMDAEQRSTRLKRLLANING